MHDLLAILITQPTSMEEWGAEATEARRCLLASCPSVWASAGRRATETQQQQQTLLLEAADTLLLLLLLSSTGLSSPLPSPHDIIIDDGPERRCRQAATAAALAATATPAITLLRHSSKTLSRSGSRCSFSLLLSCSCST